MLAVKDIIKDCISYQHEQSWFDFCDDRCGLEEIGERVSALSNAAAMTNRSEAWLIWGIRRGTHEFTNTTFHMSQDAGNENLEHFLDRNIFPSMHLCFEETHINNKRLVVMRIPAARTAPTAFKEIRYLRIGGDYVDLRRNLQREAELFHTLYSGFPNLVNTKSQYTDLKFDQLLLFFKLKEVELNEETFKADLSLLTPEGSYNMLAQLLSDNPHIPIRFAYFDGKDKTSTLNSVKEHGNRCLLVSLESVLVSGYFFRLNPERKINREEEMKEHNLFDTIAFDVAVINAFVHNNWTCGSAPMFAAYEDRIEIISIGTLPPNQTIEGFFQGVSVPVNKELSKVFHQLRLSGDCEIPRIVDVYGREAFDFRDNCTVVTIPYHRHHPSG